MNSTETRDGATPTRDDLLMHELGASVSSGAHYVLSRINLALAETKLAVASLAWVIALAIASVVLSIGVWVLSCVALSYVLIDAMAFSAAQALGSVTLLNLILLLVLIQQLKSLIRSLVSSKKPLADSNAAGLESNHCPEVDS